MSNTPSHAAALSDAEAAAFRSLGLPPGHWAALAPVPLMVTPGLRAPCFADFDSFRRLAQLFPGEPGRPGGAEEFWSRHCGFAPRPVALALLGWHLAHRVPRVERERYLAAVDEASVPMFLVGARPDVVRTVRESLEAALPHLEFSPNLAPRRVAPAGGDASPGLRGDDIGPQLFADPSGPWVDVVARALAAQSFSERYENLRSLGEWVRKLVPGAVGEQVTGSCLDRLREQVEELLRSCPEDTDAEPPPAPAPPPVTPKVGPPASAVSRSRVEVVTPRECKPLTFAEALARPRPTVAEVRDWLADPANANRLLFDDARAECPEVAVVRDPAAVPKALWVIGDVHADILALENIVAHAERVAQQEGEPPAYLFLGDFVDRGRFDHETLLTVYGLVLMNPGRVCVIPGNHDVDLRWAEKAGRFAVTIQPAEYCERLNALLGNDAESDREQLELARLSIEFWKHRPKAVFLPDGMMFSHGGFPHTDLQRDDKRGVLLREVRQLGESAALSDFLWARLSEGPKKRPNRGGNRGHEFGWKDFAQFCQIMCDVVKVPVRRLVRGHDHVAGRWHLPAEYADHPVLTINAMGWRLDGEPDPADGPHPFPVIARHVPDELPLIVKVPLDPLEVERSLGREPMPPSTAPVDTPAVTTEAPIGDEPSSPAYDFPGGVALSPVPTPPPTERMPDCDVEGAG